MRNTLVAALLLTAAPIGLAHGDGADFYVSADGNDVNPGTIEKPFATIAKAQQAVRGRIAAGLNADLKVLIRGGVYRIAETLSFGPQDSGTGESAVTYTASPGEEVVISGGRAITLVFTHIFSV